jgi:hypothetical protein
VEPARSIGKLGFRRWYERQLIESHAWLVTCFLCLIAIAAALEVLSFRENVLGAVLSAGFVVVAGRIGWFGLQRYRLLMDQAERLAEDSTCRGCTAYGIFNVLQESPRMTVRCRKCGHEWTFS